MGQDRIIEKVRKLLRLSRSENPYEAALAAERAQQMLSEYNLTEGMIDEKTEKARQINRKTRKRLEDWAHILASRTADVFDCQYFHDRSTGETSFVGVGADPEVCGWMYGYLYKTLLRLASEHLRGHARRLWAAKSKREARKSFLLGAVSTIGHRMAEQKKETPVTPCALVPVKDGLIRAAMPDDIKAKELHIGKLSALDRLYGMMTAKNIPLSRPIAGGSGCGISVELRTKRQKVSNK